MVVDKFRSIALGPSRPAWRAWVFLADCDYAETHTLGASVWNDQTMGLG